MVETIYYPLNRLFAACCGLLHNYALAIVLFTFLTKVILFPIGLWTQYNTLKMVSLMPEINRLKMTYYGDKETIAEETQKLYQQVGYHPLLSMLPMCIQLFLLGGVIGAVRGELGQSGSVLALVPSETGGMTLLMPLAAGCAALLLGISQNHLNPLQREQVKAERLMTNGMSIMISLVLGAFVPLGVGIYWIFSNLFSILQQILANVIIKPQKYIDYEALNRSRVELNRMDSLEPRTTREEKRREKTDYKRFFSVVNKHLVFYSEKSGFYKYFQNVIDYLLNHSNVIIHYVTSDPQDQIFAISESEPRIRPYYIGEKRLITLMMKMDAEMVVMTMPDLENFHIKRSYVRNDIEYIYMFHGILGGTKTLRPGALDHYDTLLVTSRNEERQIRLLEEATGTPAKKLVPCGYGLIENMAAAYTQMEKHPGERVQVLIAPSWQPDNILESCLIPLAQALLKRGYRVTVRPHPQYLKRFSGKFQEITQSCKRFPGDQFQIEQDFSSNETVFSSDLLITDWSGIGYEYALATLKPVLYVNTPMKVVNPLCMELDPEIMQYDLKLRELMGRSIEPENVLEQAGEYAAYLLANGDRYKSAIEAVRNEEIYHFGESGKIGGQYILASLKERKK